MDPSKQTDQAQSNGATDSLSIHVRARSVLPLFHFELPESDYLTAGRRNPELRGPHGQPPGARLDAATRVLEVQAVGLGEKVVRYEGNLFYWIVCVWRVLPSLFRNRNRNVYKVLMKLMQIGNSAWSIQRK